MDQVDSVLVKRDTLHTIAIQQTQCRRRRQRHFTWQLFRLLTILHMFSLQRSPNVSTNSKNNNKIISEYIFFCALLFFVLWKKIERNCCVKIMNIFPPPRFVCVCGSMLPCRSMYFFVVCRFGERDILSLSFILHLFVHYGKSLGLSCVRLVRVEHTHTKHFETARYCLVAAGMYIREALLHIPIPIPNRFPFPSKVAGSHSTETYVYFLYSILFDIRSRRKSQFLILIGLSARRAQLDTVVFHTVRCRISSANGWHNFYFDGNQPKIKLNWKMNE